MAQEWNRETLWRQGHLLSDDTFAKLFPDKKSAGYATAIIISHDCDLAASLEKEPTIELMFCRFVAKLDGNNAASKSSRQLHLPLSNSQTNLILDVQAVDKVLAEKAKIFEEVPDNKSTLTREELTTLRQWLSNRYARSSFSNEFDYFFKVNRFKDKFSAIIGPLGSTLEAVYFEVDDEEPIERTDGDPPFDLTIRLRYTLEHDEQGRERTVEAADKIRDLFNRTYFDQNANCWKNIELKNCFAVSNDAMTVAEHQKMKIWDVDYLSLQANPQQSVVKR